MVQINFSIPETLNNFLELLSKENNTSRSALAKKFFIQGIEPELFPFLAKLYQEEKISLKTIVALTQLSLTEVMREISQYINDLSVDDHLIEYSHATSEKVLEIFRKS